MNKDIYGTDSESRIPEFLFHLISEKGKAGQLYHFLADNAHAQGIHVKEINMEGLGSAAAANIAGEKVIGIEKSDSLEEKVFSLAHELSHIHLGHLENHNDTNKCEQQADFAAGILLGALCLAAV